MMNNRNPPFRSIHCGMYTCTAEMFIAAHRGSGAVAADFSERQHKKHEFEPKFNVCKCNTLRHDEPCRLASIVLLKSSHSRETQNTYLRILVVVAHWFLLFHYCSAAAVSFQPR